MRAISRLLLMLGLLVLALAGAGLTAAQEGEAFPEGYIAYISGNGRTISLIRPDGSDRHDLTEGSGPLLWSPNGRTLAFLHYVSAPNNVENQILTLIDADGSNPREVSPQANVVQDVHWSPDGSQLAFVEITEWSQTLVLVDASGGNRRLVLGGSGARHVRWSPDSQRLAFTLDLGSGVNLYVAEADGSETRRLTQMQTVYGFDWSPDGSQLVLMAGARSDRRDIDIWRIDVDGANMVRLTDAQAMYCHPNWSPDGAYIVFSRSGNSARCGDSDVYIIRPDGTGLRQLTSGYQVFTGSTVWSPDGQWIYYHVPNEDGVRQTYVMDVEGRAVAMPPELTDSLGAVFSPDGEQALFVSDYDGETRVYIMNIDGTNLRPLIEDSWGFTRPVWQPVVQPPRAMGYHVPGVTHYL